MTWYDNLRREKSGRAKDDTCVDHVVVGQVSGARDLPNINFRTDVQPKLSQTSFSELADSLSKRDCLLEQDNLTHVLLQGALSNPLRMSGSPKYEIYGLRDPTWKHWNYIRH